MRAWIAVLLYLLWIFVGAGILAPALWWGAHGLADATGAAWARGLADHPFHRYVTRTLQVLALAGLVPFARALGCRGWRDLGLHGDPAGVRRCLGGLGLGLVTFAGVITVERALGLRVWRESLDAGVLAVAVARALASGVVVGVLEELLFRGLLFGGLRRATGVPLALAGSTAIYAAVHFLERGSIAAPETVWSGWHAVMRLFSGWRALGEVYPRVATLAVAGFILGWLFWRTGSLYASIGLHAGWVFWNKMRGTLTRGAEVDGAARASDWVALGAVVLVLLLVWLADDRIRGRHRPGGAA